MSMFQRMFGRRRSPGDGSSSPAVEATEEQPEVNNDGFVVVGDDSNQDGAAFGPPPGYSLGGAAAFLPYNIDPTATPRSEPQSAIDGVPFKLGSKIILEGSIQVVDLTSAAEMIEKINMFNWDDYEYDFQLERSILQEFTTTEHENFVE
ncbi:uncharacterized protein [Macrobrachium rosenbergii]|uniref:uncharacterized protein n=1 Tax=Macrobrachium rosenbergii TaxID=79674 RepID=UPI0034D3D3EB